MISGPTPAPRHRMPPTYRDEGIHAAKDPRSAVPGLPVPVFSPYVEETYAGSCWLTEAAGSAICSRIGSPRAAWCSIPRWSPSSSSPRPPAAALTPRERDVLALLAEGHDNGKIAERLVVSEGAVLKHIGDIFTELDLPPTDGGHRRVVRS